MSLMISVSGIRGIVGESLTPRNLTAFTTAFATWVFREKIRRGSAAGESRPKILLGRDTRPTGRVIGDLVSSALSLCGCDVLDLGVATTPTVEIAVQEEDADGGLIITASHNPVAWNALKMLNHRGEFLGPAEVAELLDIAEGEEFRFARWNETGNTARTSKYDDIHIDRILQLGCIDTAAIGKERFRVLVDCVEGAGFSIVPKLCRKLGIAEVTEVACSGSGLFPRNPEPVEENLQETIAAIEKSGCDFALVVDPDVDRLAVICADGSLFGEEYTLVACADFYLRHHPGPVANNLSSSRALRDIARRHHVECRSAKVGEANVTALMKETGAVIGGEGNGGVILPELHYGRDALAGIALFVQAFTLWRQKNRGGTLSRFRQQFPDYYMSKQKITLDDKGRASLDDIFAAIAASFGSAGINTMDGLKLDFSDSWVHLRPSNTEPIVRIYSEAPTKEEADALAERLKKEIREKAAAL